MAAGSEGPPGGDDDDDGDDFPPNEGTGNVEQEKEDEDEGEDEEEDDAPEAVNAVGEALAPVRRKKRKKAAASHFALKRRPSRPKGRLTCPAASLSDP